MRMIRLGEAYEALKNRYFEWLETSEDPLNLKEYALIYEDIELD